MKKLIYCACAALLTVACTEEELIQQGVETGSHGITFAATLAEGADDATRGAFEVENGKGHFFWYAEQDVMSVYADNVNGTNGVVTDWTSLPSPAVYKATKSERQGQFTAVDNVNILSFKNDNKANFVALYPSTTTLSAATTAAGAISDVTLSIGANATQTVPFNAVAAPMYSISQGARNADYHSVGEKMNVSFKRPFPVVMLTSAEGNDKYFEDYEDYIGGLKSVKLSMEGATYKDKNNATQAFKSVIGSSTAVTWNKKNNTLNDATAADITVTVPTSVWNSEDNIYMSILPAIRNNVKCPDNNVRSFKEAYTLTYAFENITLVKNVETTKDWNEGHALYKLPALDIATDFPYIVTDEGRTLIVFSGAFSQIYHKTGTTVDGVAWNNGKVDWSDITTIIVEDGVTMTDADLQGLDRFTALTTLELNGITAIPAKTFDGELVSTLTTLNLPDVTTINADQLAFEALVNLNLQSYAFGVAGIETIFFNDDVKATLVDLNIEAVTSLRPVFGAYRTIYFTDYTELETVALNETQVALTSDAFKGCTSLETVTGIVDIANAPSAFEGTTALTTVNVVNAVIPNAAFKGSAVKNILLSGKQVVPTEVGENAFANNTAIQVLDLSKTTKIGLNAFLKASSYVGMGNVVNGTLVPSVLTVGATTIGQAALSGTAVEYVQFMNVEVLPHMLLANASALKQVKFLQVVELADEANVFSAVTTSTVDLFVVTTQDDVNGNTWTLVGKTFKSITKEDTPWGE